jgi:hypothetical protein
MDFKEITKDGQKFLVITLPISDDGALSSTGKTESYGTTHGNVSSGIMKNGKPLMVGVNAFTSIPKHLRKPVVAS